MANVHQITDLVLREALDIAHEKASFLGTINRQYDNSFSANGGKVSDTIRIKLPHEFVRRKGSRIMDVQDIDDQAVSLTRAFQDGVDLKVNSAEIVNAASDPNMWTDWVRDNVEPAMSTLVSGIESDALIALTRQVYNTVGTPGTVVGASADISALTDARTKLNQFLAPKDGNRCVQLDSLTMGSVTQAVKSLFQDSTQISEAFREGFISRNAMADWYENERTYVHTMGSDHTGITVNDAAIANGDTVLTLAGATMAVGDIFTINNVNSVHPETKVAYTPLMQFAVTAVNGNDYTFSPALYFSGPHQNINAVPSNGATVTALGTASTAYRHNLMYHKNAFTFATADLPIMDDAAKCVRRAKDGISMRCWTGSDIRNDEMLMRIDVLYGWAALRPQWACRITN